MEQLRKDPFTDRLLEVYKELVNLGAIGKKKDFIDAIGITNSYFHSIETRMRNYPQDDARRSIAIARLLELWNVNPEYMKAKSKGAKVFLKPPDIAKYTKAEQEDRIDFAAIKAHGKLKRDNEELRKKLLDMQQRVAVLQEELTQYKSKTDINPDK